MFIEPSNEIEQILRKYLVLFFCLLYDFEERNMGVEACLYFIEICRRRTLVCCRALIDPIAV
jgi:hypothetical protein